MSYPLINYTWKYKFLIISIFLSIVCYIQYNTIERERIKYKSNLDKIISSNITQKNILLEKIREQEIEINNQ